jgi:signal transduction histidine kinase
VTNALKLLRASIPSTITIDERISLVRAVCADEGQVVQVLTNLTTNAAQAIGNGMGTITVSLSEVVRSNLGDHGPAVRITVADTGCGMDEATRGRVFDPFFTTKEVGKGTGLGLSVVHGIVTGHGGVITIASELGRGTRVDIDLSISAVAATPLRGEAA